MPDTEHASPKIPTLSLLRGHPTLARLAGVLKPYFRRLLIAMVGMVAVGVCNALQAWMVQPLLDEIFYRKDERLLHVLPLALLAVFFVKGIFYFAYSYSLEKVGQCIIRDLRNRIYAHIHELSLAFFHKTPTGELISRIMNDVSMLQGAVSHALIRLLRDLFSVLGRTSAASSSTKKARVISRPRRRRGWTPARWRSGWACS